MPNASASATSSGARVTGTANRSGTKTACVGTVKPEPTSIRTCPAAARLSTYSAAVASVSGRTGEPMKRERQRGAHEAAADDQFAAALGQLHAATLS